MTSLCFFLFPLHFSFTHTHLLTHASLAQDFFSPKLLPVLSISFLLVAMTLSVTGVTLGGPPLCYESCDQCLSKWSLSIKMPTDLPYDPYRVGCG